MASFQRPPRRGTSQILICYSVAVTVALLLIVWKAGGACVAHQNPSNELLVSQECPACSDCNYLKGAKLHGSTELRSDIPIAVSPLSSIASTINLPNINLLEVLGPHNGLSSVSSVAYMAYNCVPPLREALVDLDQEGLRLLTAEIEKGLIDIVVSTTKLQDVDAGKTLLGNLGLESTGVNDPRFLEARSALSDYAASKSVWLGGKGACCAAKDQQVSRQGWSGLRCEEGKGIRCVGHLSSATLLLSLKEMAEALVQRGHCTDPPQYTEGYANQMAKVRMFNDSWHLFNVETQSEDAILFSFQLLYEHHMVFLRQHWLGVVAMQNPFDAWAIQDIIYTHKPDLIIESGTATGGSALMWASILHLGGINGRVLTIDVTRPEEMSWAQKRENPWDSPLWQHYVRFIHGSSLASETLDEVRHAAANASTVLVLLDSSHMPSHVRKETEAYCPLATVGSYCLVQDTKMNRFGWTGPLPAVREFLEKYPNFKADRDRELLFTDHPSGYLKRLS